MTGPAPEGTTPLDASATLLALENVTTYYAQMRILEGISLTVGSGELVCLLGGNASGKSTTLKTILGIVRPRSGRVMLNGTDVTSFPVPRRIAMGMAIVPENRRLFGQLTVRENLELGAVLRRGESLAEDFDRVQQLFPRLLERRNQLAGTLSGGEQQMVAMGRALMSRPRLLLMDEPSMGLSPALVQQNFQIISNIHASGVAVLMVEQNANMALSIADRGYVLSTGEIVLAGSAAELLSHDELKRAYLGRLSLAWG
jgi:branched-chain amino acid transport system ATP-binding protein